MITLIREGGVPILFVLLFGGVCLVSSLSFALRPGRSRLGFLKWMHLTVLFATLSGTVANIGATFHYLAAGRNGATDPVLVLFEGLGESMSTPILGFALLSLSALGVAVGLRRLGSE
jgi:hypothetical protein